MPSFGPEKSQIIYFASPDIDWKIQFQSSPQRMKCSRHVTHQTVASLIVDGKIVFCGCACGVSEVNLKKPILL